MTRSLRRLRVLARVSLVMLFVVVVAGAAVRLSGSGLGCADWPRCSEQRMIDVSSPHAAIEQINRLYSGLVAVVAAVVFVAALAVRPRRRDLVTWSGLAVAGVAANVVLGGISVVLELHPLAVQAHLLLALGCVVATTVLLERIDRPRRVRAVESGSRRLVALVVGMTAVAIVTGTVVTAAGPHAGDARAERLDVEITTVVPVHSLSVIGALLAALALVARLRRRPADRKALGEWLSTWIFLGLLQGTIGYVQYFNGVPELLVGVHVGGATLLTWAATRLWLTTTAPQRVEQQPSGSLTAIAYDS